MEYIEASFNANDNVFGYGLSELISIIEEFFYSLSCDFLFLNVNNIKTI